MKTITSFLLGLSVLVVFSLTLVQRKHNRVLVEEIKALKSLQSCSGNYIWNSMLSENIERQAHILPLLTNCLKTNEYVIFVPAGLCRACFMSLLFQLQDNDLIPENILVLSESNDIEIKSLCAARGIDFSVIGHKSSGANSILIARKYCGFLPIVMNYRLEDAPLFNLFLSDEESLLIPDSSSAEETPILQNESPSSTASSASS